jgi:hypothetical protein
MSEDEVRARRLDADQALAVPATPASAVDGPSGFDPSRIAKSLSDAQRRCVMVLGPEFKTPPRGHAYWASTMLYGDKLTRFRYVGSRLNKREYCLTTPGLAVKHAIATEARRAETAKQGSVHEGAGRKASPKGQHHGQ